MYIFIIVLLAVRCTSGAGPPIGLSVGIGPEFQHKILEMKSIERPMFVFLTDVDGRLVNDTGNVTIWYCTVTLISGPGSLEGDLNVPFVDGIATFPNISISKSGSGYQLQWKVKFPTTTGILPVNSLEFSVGPRPLGLAFNEDLSLFGENQEQTLQLSVMDLTQNEPAEPSVLENIGWNCSLTLIKGKGKVMGDTTVTVPQGIGSIIFPAIKLQGVGEGKILRVSCDSVQYNNLPKLVADSTALKVYPFPSTGLLRRTYSQISFSGPYALIDTIIMAYKQQGLIGKGSCTGCPVGVLPKIRGKRSGDLEETYLDVIKEWNPCQSPLYTIPQMYCK